MLIEIASRGSQEEDAKQSTEDQATGGSDLDRLFELFESAGEHITDGVVAQDQKQFDQIWFLRESVGPANAHYGYVSI